MAAAKAPTAGVTGPIFEGPNAGANAFQQEVKLPNPWDQPPWNGNKAAYLRDQVQKGSNFSHLLNDPEFSAEYDVIRGERAARQEAQRNSPEYRAMVAREQAEREAKQRAALDAQRERSGGFLGDLTRAAWGTATLPVQLARSTPGLEKVVGYTPAGALADVQQAGMDALLPGGSGLSTQGTGPVYRAAAPIAQGAANYFSPAFNPPAVPEIPTSLLSGGPGAAGAGGGGAAGERDFAAELGEAGQGEANAQAAIDDLTEAFDQRAPDPLALQAARNSREQAILDRLDSVNISPREAGDRALASALAAASAAPGGGSARRAQQFQVAQNAGRIRGDAEASARAQELERAQIAAQVGTQMSAQELGEYQSNLGAAQNIFNQSAQLRGLGQQLDQREQELFGAMARHAAEMGTRWAQLGLEERKALMQAELARYGLDKQVSDERLGMILNGLATAGTLLFGA